MKDQLPAKIRLYRPAANGELGYWEGSVEKTNGQEAHIHFSSARNMHSPALRSTVSISGKNLGKANETTAYQQALQELNTRVQKKLRLGYSFEATGHTKPITGSTGAVIPQKAKPLSKVNTNKIDWDNAYVQRKYDGHRATIDAHGTIFSSMGNVIDLPHFQGIDLPAMADCELYAHGYTLQEIGSFISSYKKGFTENIRIIVFDCIDTDLPFSQRFPIVASPPYNGIVQLAPTYKVTSIQEVMNYHSRFLLEGYEGTIIRQGNNPYKPGSRCQDLIKVKDFDDAEFTVTDYRLGQPKRVNGELLQQPVYTCSVSTPRGLRTFEVLAPGSVQEKHEQFLNIKNYINKPLTVQFFGYTIAGIPNLPVAKNFRKDL